MNISKIYWNIVDNITLGLVCKKDEIYIIQNTYLVNSIYHATILHNKTLEIAKMKVLHVYDTAGSSSIIASYQKLIYEKVHVVTMKRLDKFGISEFYGSELFDGSPLRFYLHVAKIAREYDVLHVHSLFGCIKWLRLLYPFKKIILQYHGSDLRLTKYNWSKIAAELSASKIFLTTSDLKSYCHSDYVIVGNPIDIEHFKPNGNNRNGKSLAFYESSKWNTDFTNPNTDYFDRNKTRISYKDMPAFLNQYSGYIDIKIMNNKILQAMSKTGLESIACGLKVMRYDGKIITELPNEFNPKYVVKLMDKYYSE